MVIEWREREHEEVDVAIEGDMDAPKYFQICGLYKFWAIKGMRDQVRFLLTLINYWDLETKVIDVDVKPLRIEVDDIYLISWLYC
jgi:hypothetical protein